ncbi:hypothetical protein [Actinacidiphila yeochonensis]|uniref:hypothetical protein n=1 Tax=Actinacidiphila yeochonensis TaxID=89050 RepID=UPI000559FCE0|nr:hypothetical protein [Actinacidiphila yeochonensis]
MSTTRHLINRQRRLAATAAAERTVRPARARAAGTVERPRPRTPEAEPPADLTRTPGTEAAGRVAPAERPDPADRSRPAAPPRVRTRRTAATTRPAADDDLAAEPQPAEPEAEADPEADPDPDPEAAPSRRIPRLTLRLPLLLALLAVVTAALGVFAAVAANRASGLRDDSAAANTALTDNARTSEVKGAVAQDVNAVFSYDYADTARTDSAAKRLLTGAAVKQYATLIGPVRAAAGKEKLVLTTTVTDTGVATLDGDRAHLLVFADQSNTSAAQGAASDDTYAAAMFAVDAVRQGGTWKISAIDTFN